MHNYFRSLRFWYVDVVVCYVIAAAITPADPYSAVLAFVALMVIWLPIRYFVARRLTPK